VGKALNKKRITIYDIAVLAKTSASTVGSVLNGTWKSRRISKAMAQKVEKIAHEQGYSVNMQASALRRKRSGIIGMILPMYDNRYFSSIAQLFEQEARARDLFPMISCTLRDPELEVEAVRSMLNYRVEQIVCTGATDPDKITELCHSRGVPTFNLDLPGTKAPSVISDNYSGAFDLTSELLSVLSRKPDKGGGDMIFIGGRNSDHNTKERIRGFQDANKKFGNQPRESNVLAWGYAADKAENALKNIVDRTGNLPSGIFVNSTISLEGVMNWFQKCGIGELKKITLGCFDWDPFAIFLDSRILMIRQNVPDMMHEIFSMVDGKKVKPNELIEIKPTIIIAP